MNSNTILSISELNHGAKLLLEQTIPLAWVSGEISNLKCYSSGHWYFSLKDNNAQVRCVMFYHKNRLLDWRPTDGLQVEARVRVTLFEPRGEFQLNVETIRQAGLGTLFAAFEQLKAKLDKAGLFDQAHKQALPAYPKQIGVITSPKAAALYDVLSTLKKRLPAIRVIVYPTVVQGRTAAENIARAIELATQHGRCETLIVCRGGGSLEDLWAFNEEIVARAIYKCPIPIICGIGHETDFTIADFVADVRAPTPTSAAQHACPDGRVLRESLVALYNKIKRSKQYNIERSMQNIDVLAHRLVHPGERIQNQFLQLQHLYERLTNTWLHFTNLTHWQLNTASQHISTNKPDIKQLIQNNQKIHMRLQRTMTHYMSTLQAMLTQPQRHLIHLSPNAVLERGYSISYTAKGKVIRDSKQINQDDNIQIYFGRGKCYAQVTKKLK